MKLNINTIHIKERKRSVNDQKLGELAASIAEIGLLNPVTVRANNSHYELVAGLHRLKACELLGWDTIDAQVFEGDDTEAELAEIDENLRRSDLNDLQQSQHLSRREEILKARGNRAEQGNNRFTIDRGDTVTPLKTTKDMAQEVGLSERSMQRRLQIARDILPDVQDDIQEMPIADSTTQLLELARMQPDEQRKVVEVLKEKPEASVTQAKREITKRGKARR